MSQDTRPTSADVYRSLNSPRKPGSGAARRQRQPRTASAKVVSVLTTLAALVALVGIGYWALSRPGASLPERIGRFPRMTNQGALESTLATADQGLTKGDVKVGVYGDRRPQLILAIFANDGSPNLDAFAARAGGDDADALQNPKAYTEVRRGGTRVRCVLGGLEPPFLTQCLWQEGGTYAVVIMTEPTLPGAEKLAAQSHDAAITSWLDRFLHRT